MYRVDPNDSEKQIPDILPNDVFDKAIAPSASNHSYDIPDQVYVAVSRTNLQFQFGESGSGFVNFGTVPIGTILDIGPTAWNNSAAAAGDVIYIYKGRK